MNGLVSRQAAPELVKPERTYLDLPTAMAEEYMDAVFQHGPTSDEARRIYELHHDDSEWGELFREFAQAIDELKIAVCGGTAEARAAEASASAPVYEPTACQEGVNV